LKEAEEGKRQIFFVDASHFVFSVLIGYLWTKVRRFVKGAHGRKRFNVLGAINPFTLTLLYEVNDGYVNAETVCQLLRQIKKRGFKWPVTLVMDNARYQRCHLVQDLAETLRIELLFLPSYSPNLNLIERYWKYLKGKLFRCRSIEKFELFCTSITGILDDRSAKRKEELATLLAPNFQIFDETVIC
jgi:transposase